MISVQDAVDITSRLISIPSISPGSGVNRCAIAIRDMLEDIGIEASIVRCGGVSNVIASYGKKGGKRILWNGNFDVVSTGNIAKWDTNPFEPVYKDGNIYGRGAADMKSGIASMILALKGMREKRIVPDGEIVFMAVGDGETGSINGTIAMLNKLGADYDAALVPVPTDFCVESAQRGLRWIEIKVKGLACHAARPHIGRNAVEQAAKIIVALKSMKFDITNPFFEEELRVPTISVNKIHGGIQNNIIAEECKMTIDRRMLPQETEEKVLREIRSAVESVLDEGFCLELNVVNKGWDPYMLNEDEPILKQVMASFKTVMGTEPVVRGKGGCTDASHIFNAGIPVVIFGPGSVNESHTTNEKVCAERIASTAEIFTDATLNFLKDK